MLTRGQFPSQLILWAVVFVGMTASAAAKRLPQAIGSSRAHALLTT